MKKGWTTKTLGEICVVDWGNTDLTKSSYVENGRYLAISAAGCDGRIGHKEHEKCTPVLSAIGAQCGRMFFPEEDFTAIKNTITLTPRDGTCTGRFLYQLLTYVELPKRGAAQPFISKGDIQTFQVSVPPLSEQQRIVGILDEAFDGLAIATANAEQNLRNARAFFESHLQSVFTQRGKGWMETTLSEATGGVLTGPFGSLLHKSDYIEGGIPLVNPAHITETGIEPDFRKTVSEKTARQLSNYIMREGDIVIGRRGEMGRCALVTDAEDGWLCGTGSFFIKPSGRCEPRYLVRFLRSDSCKRRLERLAGGAVMPNLSNTDLGDLHLYLPPVDQQKTIVGKIDALYAETQRLKSIYQQKLAALGELKQSLLHEAFSGKL
ncbi:putative Type I restriction-modification system, specificity subunit [Candidatus Nitrospira nitrosa]|uniref:Putative Type I restriction-modification system, specificity subunit n=1 Tax=Candidatus Nitrospira nitrosa TaxID=1742972 RepID=A0A0S4LJD7_9BACT|nr:restriction endonuclease subunit S [Candidatus Nitrospira nitrosa]CUS36781.1 putative Type I restriction-modification system, specificity subunit [Candidatus Nitrospira nitrosa]